MASSLVVVVALAVLVLQVQAQDSLCYKNDQLCLSTLRDFLTRTNWWFGSQYMSDCPAENRKNNFACINPDTLHTTIISRVLQSSNYDVKNITQFLRIRFYAPAGTYQACGHWFNVPAVYMDKDLDFILPTGIDGWTTRNRPAITWDPHPGDVYTLLAYNVDQLRLSGLWMNINGGDSALGQELYPYMGPQFSLNRTSFLVFLLFRQDEVISDMQLDFMKQEIQEKITNNGGVYRVSDLGLETGPIGAAILSSGADPYGIDQVRTVSMYNNCPWLIARMRPLLKKVVDVHNLTALGANVGSMEVEVEVTYKSDSLQYSACCMNLSEDARILKIDPLSQTPVNSVFLRSSPTVGLSAVNMLDSTFFFNKLYTILLLDVTWATVDPGTRQTSLLWHMTNIPGLSVTSGLTLRNYTMPIPPLDRTGTSLYTFFVFRQNETIGNYTFGDYCGTSSANDCNFNLYKFAQDKSLRLSGINWFFSQTDMYSRMKIYEADKSKMDTTCKGVSGYGNPCPNPCAVPTPKPTPGGVTAKTGSGTVRTSASFGFVLLCTVFVVLFRAACVF